MKKGLKITFIALGILASVVALDTLQAKIFNHSPLLKIRDHLNEESVNYIDKGLFVNYYHCSNNEQVTTWKKTKFACSMKEEASEEKYVKTVENTNIELNILKDWHYEEIKEEDYQFALKLYKDSKDQYASLIFYNNPFGVCGTGRTTEELTLNNGVIATIGYYGEPIWTDISFYELNPNIAFMNNGLEENDTKEFLEIVKTLNIKNVP